MINWIIAHPDTTLFFVILLMAILMPLGRGVRNLGRRNRAP